MYTIANKNNKKTRKISSSSRNKHKSKSKNKHKHKYTIGKTRKYTKSYFNLQNGGVTFQDFKTTIQTLFGKFTPDSPDSPDSKYTPDKLFFHLTIAATSITAPDQQKKALHIIQTMYIFYSNQFTPNANSPLRKTITRKYPTIKVTPLTTKPTLLTTDLGEDLSTVIYDKLTAAAKKHTVHATPTITDTQSSSLTSSLSSSWENTASASTSAASTSAASTSAASTSAASTSASATKWDKWNTLSFQGTGNDYKVRVAQDGSKPKYADGYRILFGSDGKMFAWGKQPENILKRLNGEGDHLEQLISIKDITEITKDVSGGCKNIHGFKDDFNFCITIKQTDDPNEWYFAFFNPQVREDFRELLPSDPDLVQTRAAAQVLL